MTVVADWIAVDWGSSCLRVWAMQHNGQVLAAHDNEQGVTRIKSGDYEAVLLQLIQDWLPASRRVPVVVCGMAGSRQGWQEAAYQAIPLCLPAVGQLTSVATAHQQLNVSILPGLKQTQPADVMRGEETQLAGFLTQQPAYSGVVILPGTHSKWVKLVEGCVQQFHTCMTGELFQLLSEQSMLRHSLHTPTSSDPNDSATQAVFEQAATQALQTPAALPQALFGLRAQQLLHNTAPETLRAQLSGLLLGTEISAMQAAGLIDSAPNVTVIAGSHLAPLYAQALQVAGIQTQQHAGDTLVVAGLYSAYQTITGSASYA